MKKLTVILLCFLSLISCGDKEEVKLGPKEIKLSPQQIELIDGSNQFGFNLFREVLKDEEDGENVFISPLSVHLALSMTWNGAAGTTREQMMDVLNYPGYDDETINRSIKKLIDDLLSVDSKVETGIANSIWYRDGFNVRPEFLDVNRRYFDAMVSALDFNDPASLEIINSWVKGKTKGKIEEIIDQIDPADVMYLTNAIYFKGIWSKEFIPEETKKLPFNLLTGNKVDVMTMVTEGDFGYAHMDGYQVAELPYGQGNYSMIVFLPDTDIGIDRMVEKLGPVEWKSLSSSLTTQNVNIRLPKFTFEFELDLASALMRLGMVDAFGPADFTGISKSGGLFIDRVVHKTFVDVNEEGTEAAAVTAVVIQLSYNPDWPKTVYFHVNRPFLFALKEKYTNSLIFIGRVMEP
jgi:serine protease inhibitor